MLVLLKDSNFMNTRNSLLGFQSKLNAKKRITKYTLF